MPKVILNIFLDISLIFVAWTSKEASILIADIITNYHGIIQNLDVTVKLLVSCLVLITVLFRLKGAGKLPEDKP